MTRKTFALCAALILLASLPASYAVASTLTPVQETVLALPSGDAFEGVLYAAIENTGDVPQQFEGGLFELFDAAGNSVGTQELYYYDCNPEVLKPGEKGFLFSGIVVNGASDAGVIDHYTLTVWGTARISTSLVRFPAEAFYQQGEGEGEHALSRYTAAILQNETDDTLRDFFAGFAVKDENGNLLYVTSGTWASSGVTAHSRMEIRLRVDERVVDYWIQNGIEPAGVEVIAFKTYPK